MSIFKVVPDDMGIDVIEAEELSEIFCFGILAVTDREKTITMCKHMNYAYEMGRKAALSDMQAAIAGIPEEGY